MKIIQTIHSLPLQKATEYESYCLSPAYYEFTGRNGLGLYRSATSCIVICIHPNNHDELLVFPEISAQNDLRLTFELLKKLLHSDKRIKLCRYTALQKALLLSKFEASSLSGDIDLHEVEESKLDWVYPVHILDTKEMAERKGGRFEQLRQRLRKLERNRICPQTLQPDMHEQSILELVYRWAEAMSLEGYSTDDLVTPSKKLLQMYKEAPERFIAQVLYIDEKLKSYSICEKPVRSDLPVCELTIACSNDLQGLSEWQKVLLCEEALSQGFHKINLGGSETHGLDRFKRKLGPSHSIPLYSIQMKSA